MVTTSEDRIGNPAGRRQGELPVLFHLMDVSRQRRPADATRAMTPLASPIVTEPKTDDASLSPAPITPLPIPTSPSTFAVEPQAAWPAITVPLTAPPAPTSVPPVVECLQEAASQSPVAASQGNESIAIAAPSDETPPEPVAPPRDITPRSLMAPRRKAKTPATEDWFATHGKFIAMAFVVALLGTIYFARTTRQATAPAPGTKEPPLADHKLDVQLPPQATATTGGGYPGKRVDAQSQLTTAATEPKVDLLPPTTPLTATATASTANQNAPRGSDNLFVFPNSKPAEERIASRPQETAGGQSSSVRYDSPAPPTAPVVPTAYPSTSSPALPAVPAAHTPYRQTAAPPLAAPVGSFGQMTQPAPTGPQPSTMPPPSFRSQFPLPPAGPAPQPQAWMPPPPSGPMTPGPYQPQINTALGPRYERTGSGPY